MICLGAIWRFFFVAACPVVMLIKGYLMSRDYAAVVENFRQSRLFASFRQGHSVGGPSRRASMTACFSGLVIWEGMYVRKGIVDPQELDSLPAAIRNRAFCMFWFNTFGLAGLLLIGAEFLAQQWLLDTFR